MRRRLLTSTFGVAAAAVVVLCAALALATGSHHGRLTPAKVGVGALAALAVSAVMALVQARRLARPAQDLARAASRVASGDARPVGRRYGIIELDRIADGMDFAVQRVSEMIAAEQDFAVDASHQLRTPLTALSMRLEEMVEAADDPGVVREEGAAALAQTDRLAEVVHQLLGRARRSSSGAPALSSLDEIIAQQVEEWEPAFRDKGRCLEVVGERELRAYISVGGVHRSLLACWITLSCMATGGSRSGPRRPRGRS